MACNWNAQGSSKKHLGVVVSLITDREREREKKSPVGIKPHQENVTVTPQFVKSMLTNRFLTCMIEVGRMVISAFQEQPAQKWVVKISVGLKLVIHFNKNMQVLFLMAFLINMIITR